MFISEVRVSHRSRRRFYVVILPMFIIFTISKHISSNVDRINGQRVLDVNRCLLCVL